MRTRDAGHATRTYMDGAARTPHSDACMGQIDVARYQTERLRHDDHPEFARLRDVLIQEDIRVEDAALGDLFPESQGDFGCWSRGMPAHSRLPSVPARTGTLAVKQRNAASPDGASWTLTGDRYIAGRLMRGWNC